jgi:hypothetical protein
VERFRVGLGPLGYGINMEYRKQFNHYVGQEIRREGRGW